ncbi:MAG: beta-lactamase family protein [Planctomycetales bacterium]|nr:beta-lactamase family protein [Planctomycetales bacterium]
MSLALFAIAWCLPAISAAELDSQKLAGLRGRMQKFVDQKDVSGVVAVVGTKDRVAIVESLGERDLATKSPMQPDTLFRIASMTKPITAIAIMMQVDAGKLAVDDPVEKHLPEFRGQMLVSEKTADTVTLKKPSRVITIRDLLTHTSGLPGMPPIGIGELYSKRDRTLAEGVLVYSQRPLDFEPGSKWSYCNAGIDTLGRIVEVTSGLSFEAFLEQRLFKPLGMKDTTFYPNAEQIQRGAAIYDKKEGVLQPVAHPIIGNPVNAKFPIPAGGLYSTATDLVKVYQFMLRRGTIGDRRLLSEASVATMTKVQTGDLKSGFTPGGGFGFGWAVVREPQGVTEMLSPGTYGHGGAFGTQAWIDPHQDLFVILLIQRVGLVNADASDIRKELQSITYSAIKK